MNGDMNQTNSIMLSQIEVDHIPTNILWRVYYVTENSPQNNNNKKLCRITPCFIEINAKLNNKIEQFTSNILLFLWLFYYASYVLQSSRWHFSRFVNRILGTSCTSRVNKFYQVCYFVLIGEYLIVCQNKRYSNKLIDNI